MRRLSGLAYFYIIIIAFILLQIVLAVPMRFLSSKLVPLAVSLPLFVVAVIGFIREVKRHGNSEAEMETDTNEDEGGIAPKLHGLKAYLPITGWVVGFAVGIYVIGMVVTIPVFILSYMRTHGIGWRTSIIASAVTTVTVWSLFELVLYIDLYRGLLFDALGF